MPQLSVNIDHVATVRQARYRSGAGSSGAGGSAGTHLQIAAEPDGVARRSPPVFVGSHLQISAEPDPARAAHEAELGGADGITFHLREDRRHIQDRDVDLLKQLVRVRLNFEMAATDEMVAICSRIGPHTSMLVPEGRDEVTTEGGLNAAGNVARLQDVVARLKGDGMQVSAFIDADPEQIDAAARIGFDVCEIHTGPYAAAFACAGGDTRRSELLRELDRVADAGRRIRAAGMRFNAGHALNYANVALIAAMPGVAELHIGHSIVSRAIYTGIREAVADMKRAMMGTTLA